MAAKIATIAELPGKEKTDFREQAAEGLVLGANDMEISEATREAFIQRLLAQGIIPAVPEGRPGPPPRAVSVQGKPISETLVEERR